MKLLFWLALMIGSVALTVGTVRAEVTAQQVRDAIDHGAAFVLGQQRVDGSWPDTAATMGQPGGVSALCTLALLNAGVATDDPRLQKSLQYLRAMRPSTTYVVSLQTMVFARAEPDKDRGLIGRNVKWLEGTQIPEGLSRGSWSYPGGAGDNSNAQFALLALHEAERVGIVANERTWRLARTYWERCQFKDGSWGYNTQSPYGFGSMTCAGITSMVIADDKIQAGDARVVSDRIICCQPRPAEENDAVKRGLHWLGKHYSVTRNPSHPYWLLYYLYGLERVGRLTALRFIPLFPTRPGQPDRADWYREGAEFLVDSQDGLSGFWQTSSVGERDSVVGTSFALMFLSKGRWPVLLGKLEHNGDDWNHHRGDVGNMTRYVESRWGHDMIWQVIDLRLANIDELVQTPVLYYCGKDDPLPEDAVVRRQLAQKLRGYLDRGGFLFAAADCDGKGFDRGFRQLMDDAFPEPEYKLRLLDKEHPIWFAEEKIDDAHMRPVKGIEFGCRTSVVYVPPDESRPSLSCLWDLSRPGRGVKYSKVVQDQIDAGRSLGINVLAYATNRELQTKEIVWPTEKRRSVSEVERGRLSVANLSHPGGCNSAPRALVNLMESASDTLKIRTDVAQEPLSITDESLFDYHLVFMHGRSAFRLTDKERQRLREFVERGGMLMADSICASSAFVESFRTEMAAIFPSRKLEQIAADDPLWTTKYGGFDLKLVSRRDPEQTGRSGPLEAAIHKVPPDLEGIKFGDRWGVVFSPYDLSCALEKRASLECRGYTRDDAARIGLNVVLYSLQQ